jgi:hypothetical protein
MRQQDCAMTGPSSLRFERRGTIAVSRNGSGKLKASLRKVANMAGQAKAPELLRHDTSQWAGSCEASERGFAQTPLLFRDYR